MRLYNFVFQAVWVEYYIQQLSVRDSWLIRLDIYKQTGNKKFHSDYNNSWT